MSKRTDEMWTAFDEACKAGQTPTKIAGALGVKVNTLWTASERKSAGSAFIPDLDQYLVRHGFLQPRERVFPTSIREAEEVYGQNRALSEDTLTILGHRMQAVATLCLDRSLPTERRSEQVQGLLRDAAIEIARIQGDTT